MLKFNSFSSRFSLLTTALLFVVYGCNNNVNKENSDDKAKEETHAAESGDGKIVKVEKVTFSVPSPIQISVLIKKSGANFQKAMLNSPSSSNDYSTNYSRALNLGIYGADLGYCSIYDQTQDAISYMNSLKQLADGLGISSAFDSGLFSRFKNNAGKKDSLLAVITDAFRSSDSFLKDDKRMDISALILAGGWIEGLHLMTTIVLNKDNQEVMDRIAEQKISLSSLLKLLEPFQDQKEMISLNRQLNDLQRIFDEVKSSYVYHETTHDTLNKLTTINCESKMTITKEQLGKIAVNVERMRNGIIKNKPEAASTAKK